MPKTCLVHHKCFHEHRTGEGHPENPSRLEAIMDALHSYEHADSLALIEAEPAPPEILCKIHTPEYVRRVEQACRSGIPFLDCPDTGIGPMSYQAACHAVGAGIVAVDAVMEQRVRNGFVACRPPGHHAERDVAMGFCLFNNVAIAARYLIDRWGLERILIADLDVHHGNGTQHAFEKEPRVFYFSIHQSPHYPGTGRADETGTGAGKGTVCNVPVPAGTDDATYLEALRQHLVPAAERFRPEFVLLSMGFDAHAADPLSGLALTTGCFGEMTSILVRIAETHCSGRLVSFLEGGYDCKALAECFTEHIRGLAQGG